MNLNELFPAGTKVCASDKELELQYGVKALIELERKYKNDKFKDAIAIMANFINRLQQGIGLEDMYSLLFIGLLHTKEFKTEDEVMEAFCYHNANKYCEAIAAALMNAYLTPEQLDKMQVMIDRVEEPKNAEKPTQN